LALALAKVQIFFSSKKLVKTKNQTFAKYVYPTFAKANATIAVRLGMHTRPKSDFF
jgi:hypothetical protein